MHRIALEDSAKALNSQSQLNTDYDFFKMLRDRGRRAAHRRERDHVRSTAFYCGLVG
jgi:hypothetical protein